MRQENNKYDHDFDKIYNISRIEGKSNMYMYAIIGFSLLLSYDLAFNEAEFSIVLIVLIIFSFYMNRRLKRKAIALKKNFNE